MKKLIQNLTAFILVPTFLLAGIDFSIGHFAARKIETYFDSRTLEALGRPLPAKAPNEYRVFVFGGSSAYGFPVADRHSIAAWLRKSFSFLLPDKKIQVVNTAWPGKSSHFELEGAHNVIRYKPDLFIVYTGHNEAHIDNRLFVDFWFYKLDLMLRFRSATYKFMMRYFTRLRKKIVYGKSSFVEKQYREEVIAQKIYSKADVDDEAYAKILKAYSSNVEGIIKVARKHGVKVLLTNMPSNIRRCPPFMSSHRAGLEKRQLAEWSKFFSAAEKLREQGDCVNSLKLYEQAMQIDDQYAELHYRKAQCLEVVNDYAGAKKAYIAALDLDTMPSRAKTAMNQMAKDLSAQYSDTVWFVDFISALEDVSPYGILSSEMIYDDVHPTIQAQQILSRALLQVLSKNNWLADHAQWRWTALEKSIADTESEEWKIDGNLNAYQFVLRGLKLWEQKRFDEAAKDLDKGLELMPDFIESYAFLADSYYRLGDVDMAKDSFEKLYLVNPSLYQFLVQKYPDIAESAGQAAGNLMRIKP